MPLFTAAADFQQIPALNLVVEGRPTPPVADVDATVGFLWNDTSLTGNSVMKYWDGDEWVRMDGGGDIPNGMVVDRHVAADAAIQWSKIAHPTNLATTDQVDAINTDISGVVAKVNTLVGSDTGQSVRQIAQDAIAAAGLSGSFVTLDTAQTITGVKTFSVSPVVPNGAASNEAINLGQLTSAQSTISDRIGAVETVNTTQNGRLTTLETTVGQNNTDLRTDLTALTGRVTAAEGVNTTQDASLTSLDGRLDVLEGTGAGSVSAAVAAETARAEAAEAGLDNRIDDEVDARIAGDQASTDAIAAEVTRATGAEADLDSRLDTVETAAGTVDTRIGNAITTEDARVVGLLAAKADLVAGVVPLNQLPRIAVTSTRVVADIAARDALTVGATGDVQEGDVVIVTGLGSFILNADGDWVELAAPAGGATAADLAAERQARLDGDAALGTRMDTEHTARVAAETTLQGNIDAERERATDAETANSTAVSNEVTRAEAAEGLLDGRITTEVNNRTSADNQIRTDFAAADATLQTAIGNEVSRATGAEGTLQTAITNEASRAGSAETDLGTRIDGVQGDLATEVTNRTNGDTHLQSEIDALQSALDSTNTDSGTLAGRVTGLEGRATTDEGNITALQTALSTETTARGNGDTLLQNQINTLQGDASTVGSIAAAVAAEAAARTSADTGLNNAITAEATNRAAADTLLGDQLATETAARIAGDNTNATAITGLGTAIRSEFAAADQSIRDDFAAADSTLLSNINTRALDTAVVHLAGTETVTGAKTFGVSPQVPAGTAGLDAVNFTQLDALRAEVDTAVTTGIGPLTTRVDAIEAYDTSERGRVDDALALKADLVNGKVPLSQLPGTAITDVRYFADLAARDAATGFDEGDVAIVGSNDVGVRQSFIWDGAAGTPAGSGGWVALMSPADVTEAELAAAVTAGLAPVIARLDAFEAGAGMVRPAGTDRFDIIGTTDRILVNADSVDISPNYAGQASITTVGTIVNGVWNGTTVDLAHGGTGYAATSLSDLVDHLGINVEAPLLFAKTLTGMVEGTPMNVVHGLGSGDVSVTVRKLSTGEIVLPDAFVVDDNTVSILVDASRTDGDDLRVTIIGGPVATTGPNAGRIMGRIAGKTP